MQVGDTWRGLEKSQAGVDLGRAVLSGGKKEVAVELRTTGTWYVTLGVCGRYGTITQSPFESAQGLAVTARCPSRIFPPSTTGKPTT